VVLSNELFERHEPQLRPIAATLPPEKRRIRRTALITTLIYAAVAVLVIGASEIAVAGIADASRAEFLAQIARGLVFILATSALLYLIMSRIMAAAAERERHLSLALVESYETTLAGWSRALDLRDRETEGHSARVTELAVRLAVAMGVAGEELEHLRRGAMLHDIGKIGVPDAILHKAGPLGDDEWAVMRRHPEFAYNMLQPIEFLRPVLDIPYCHHERWNGSGYPRGLAGEQIPLAARIFAVVDVWDALVSDRPYRRAWSRKQAADYLHGHAGKLFDPTVVCAFLALIEAERRHYAQPVLVTQRRRKRVA
jgi:HD-GYP domain-containing protein (c-di-GMP phosphodiesterase class II)